MKVLDNIGLTKLKEILYARFARLNSPALTGVPTAPTAAVGTNTTQVATTAFVKTAADNKASVSGNAGTATKLASARTINGVPFDGTANITAPDATKIPTSQKGAANGVASLDGNGKIPAAAIPLTESLTEDNNDSVLSARGGKRLNDMVTNIDISWLPPAATQRTHLFVSGETDAQILAATQDGDIIDQLEEL